MSDAWGLLRTYSVADSGADAWTQLNSQEGGGEVIHIGPTLDSDISSMDLTADMTTALSVNLIIDEVTASATAALSTSADSTTLEAEICQQ